MLSYATENTALTQTLPFGTFASHYSEGITLEKLTSAAVTETFKDKDCQELRFNVLLAQSTNFQHTSLLKCSLKLKLHQLKAYKAPYRRSLTVKAKLLKAIPISLDKPLRSSDGATLRSRTGEAQLYLPGIKMTVIIRFSIVIPVLVESLPHCAHLPQHR